MDPYGSKQPRGHATTVLDLVSRDEQDSTLFPLSATVTRFLTRDEDHRTIPFSSVMRECTFKGPAELGQRFLFELSDVNCGDLLQGIFIQIKMGDWLNGFIRSKLENDTYIYKDSSSNAWTYINSLGTAILEEATLEVDDQILERITGDSVDVISILFPDLNTQIGLADSLGKTTIAEVKAWTGSRALPTEEGWITVPLLFSMLREKTTATFPLLACRSGTVRVGITLKRFDQIVRPVSGSRHTCTDTPLGKTVSLIPKPQKKVLMVAGGGTNEGGRAIMGYTYDGIVWYISPSIIFNSNQNSEGCEAIGYNGRLWVAVGANINEIAWSEDGINWTPAILDTDITFISIVWDETFKLWVAGGNGTPSLIWSEDGKDWHLSTNTVISNVNSVISNGLLWIAKNGFQNETAISYDGKIWESSIDTLLANTINIVYNDGIWLAGGVNTLNYLVSITYSRNGIDWTPVTWESNIRLPICHSIVWNGSLWVACGDDNIPVRSNILAWSDNGILWHAISYNSMYNFFSIAWNGSMWVGCGYGSTALSYSFTGKEWFPAKYIPLNLPSNVPLNYIYTIVWNGSLWVADATLYSEDGMNWFNIINSPFADGFMSDNKAAVLTNLAPPARKILMVVENLTQEYISLQYSYDGKTWYISPNSILPNINGIYYSFIAYNGRRWLASIVLHPKYKFCWSDDGILWNFVVNTIGDIRIDYILWDPTLTVWVAYKYQGDFGNDIVWSTDGIVWEYPTIPVSLSIISMASDGTQFIAGGSGYNDLAILARSTNGKEWYSIDKSLFNDYCNKIAGNGSIWIASSSNPDSSLLWSENGIEWNIATYSSPIQTQACNYIVWSGTRWVSNAGLSGISLLYSIDGKHWYPALTNPIYEIYQIASNGSMWVSSGINESGSPLLAWSPDGITWSLAIEYPLNSLVTGTIRWNGYIWVINNKLFSIDGKKWQNCIVESSPLNTNSGVLTIQTSEVPPPLQQIQLLTYGAFVDGPYREMLLRQPFERPFREIQQFDFTEPLKYVINKTGNDSVVIQLPLEANQPIEEILWIARRKAALTLTNDWTNYSATLEKDYDPVFCPLEPLVSHAKIQANGMDIVSQPEAWFRSHIARAHKGGKVAYDSFIYGYSFARHPGQHDPTGSMNASRLNSLRLTLDIKTPQATTISSDTEWEVKVFVFAFQWVRFGNGICNKVFID